MKTVYVSYTYLDIVEVPDDATHEEISKILEDRAPAEWWNDIEYHFDFTEEAFND